MNVEEVKISGIKLEKDFTRWVKEKWFEHRDECAVWKTDPVSDSKTYFQKYKWWLKREFRHQKKLEQEKEQRRKKFGY